MKPGISTWEELAPLDGNVLAVVNSAIDDEAEVAALFGELEHRVLAGRLHVIAPPAWRAWLSARGVPDGCVLLTLDATGGELELNHFLENPSALLWILDKQFAFVVGTAPYAVYNDEVKDIFERRLALLLGDGRFLAHTLPNRYLLVLDLPALAVRFGRRQKLEQYMATCRLIVDDLHGAWTAHGRPSCCDDGSFYEEADVLGTHLGSELLAFDEASPIPLAQPNLSAELTGLLLYFRDLLRERDALHAERVEAVTACEVRLAELHAERVSAVNLRDTIIDELRRQHEPWLRRWRRWLRNGG